MRRRLLAAAFSALMLAPGVAAGQAFWPKETPKLPIALALDAKKKGEHPVRPLGRLGAMVG
jgi:hypothetical protein